MVTLKPRASICLTSRRACASGRRLDEPVLAEVLVGGGLRQHVSRHDEYRVPDRLVRLRVADTACEAVALCAEVGALGAPRGRSRLGEVDPESHLGPLRVLPDLHLPADSWFPGHPEASDWGLLERGDLLAHPAERHLGENL